MTEKRYDILLAGCAPVPLAHYLKALGILRLVSEQVDPQAQGWWENDSFWLRSTLDKKGLTDFFLERYEPTPIVGPWGARSGFYGDSSEKSARLALQEIMKSPQKRLHTFRHVIQETIGLLKKLGLQEKDPSRSYELMTVLRASLPDTALAWLDATYVLLDNDVKFPPLLGTGGNEGSGSYMSGFARQVVEVIINRQWDHALDNSLFGVLSPDNTDSQTPGHFDPSCTGGPNSANGFDGSTEMNPWDYLLLLEGTLLFAGACVKRLESHNSGSLAFPFCVRAMGSGYGTSTLKDEESHRPELWVPVWKKPAKCNELTKLFTEGRVNIGKRKAKNATDFGRAIATLGVDSGIQYFERYGFQLRNGDRANFSIALGKFVVQNHPTANLIADLDKDSWLESFRSVAKDENNPESARRALRKIETAILEMCQRGNWQDVQNLLIALGEAESAVAISPKLREKVKPIPPLSSRWIEQAYPEGGEIEFRLAASLASLDHEKIGPLRRHFEPLEQKTWYSGYCKWNENDSDPDVVWSEGNLVHNMTRVLQRRIVEVIKLGKQSADESLFAPLAGKYTASLGDIASFIAGDVDDKKIDRLLHGLTLVRWKSVKSETLNRLAGKREPRPFAPYALLKLCFLPGPLDAGINIPLQPAILHRAASGDIASATRLAARRLRGSGLPPAIEQIDSPDWQAKRTVAALLFPIRISRAQQLKNLVVRREEPDDTSEDPQETESEPTAHHV